MKDDRKIAFALGGLAGNNAHGAGFLHASIEENIEPVMISYTSGQIFWTYKYLSVKNSGKDNLREILKSEIEEPSDINMASFAVYGKPDRFRPAYSEFSQDLYCNIMKLINKICNGCNIFLLKEILKSIPGRILIPLFPDSFFKEISDTFNESPIGIVFNSYNPVNGREYVYLNKSARDLLCLKSKRNLERGRQNTYRDKTYYQYISEDAVKDALWLYQYGFDQDGKRCNGFLDGAYYRQIILSELVYADEIFVVRPINSEWIGQMPKNYIGIEDLKTEVVFNGTYAGEKYQINLINKLLEDGILPKDKYHNIKLTEIEILRQRDYFDYLFESIEVFDEAVNESKKKLTQ